MFSHIMIGTNDLDRAKAKLLGLNLPDVFNTLQIYLGSLYVNDFNRFGRTYQVNVQADQKFRLQPEDILRLQPDALREAGAGLGAAKWITIRDIIWKGAGAGLLTGGLLAFARISGETAPLLFTALSNNSTNWNMTQPMASLPVVIFNFALSAYDDWRRLAWAGALLVALAGLSVNILGRVLAARGKSS